MNNDKFELVSREFAILIHKDYDHYFGGGGNFGISNKSNIGGPNNSILVFIQLIIAILNTFPNQNKHIRNYEIKHNIIDKIIF